MKIKVFKPHSLLYVKTPDGWETKDEYPAPRLGYHTVAENLDVHQLAARIPFNNPEIFLRLTHLIEEEGQLLDTQVNKFYKFKIDYNIYFVFQFLVLG